MIINREPCLVFRQKECTVGSVLDSTILFRVAEGRYICEQPMIHMSLDKSGPNRCTRRGVEGSDHLGSIAKGVHAVDKAVMTRSQSM
jgi:hypothetical protein